uniref:Uncharacterized protein n=1 Tax=Siphoviridae sp. ctdau33 TaxID=2827902 RepID=A0A8S5S713_9CAUD|nr:MAG TPA: hypothetical protein [Siphoviridae sp. ctdau33]
MASVTALNKVKYSGMVTPPFCKQDSTGGVSETVEECRGCKNNLRGERGEWNRGYSRSPYRWR